MIMVCVNDLFQTEETGGKKKVPYVPTVDHLTIRQPDMARRQEVKR